MCACVRACVRGGGCLHKTTLLFLLNKFSSNCSAVECIAKFLLNILFYQKTKPIRVAQKLCGLKLLKRKNTSTKKSEFILKISTIATQDEKALIFGTVYNLFIINIKVILFRIVSNIEMKK